MKNLRRIFALILLSGTFLLNLSFDSSGRVNMLSYAKADPVDNGRMEYGALCPDKKTHITVCGLGNGTCTPKGTCPTTLPPPPSPQ